MQYWLLKSEPDVWSIDQQKKQGLKAYLGMVLEITKQQKI
jgi:predicted RNA-binding protein with PUA-like domain